jgi:hypothetical protein
MVIFHPRKQLLFDKQMLPSTPIVARRFSSLVSGLRRGEKSGRKEVSQKGTQGKK